MRNKAFYLYLLGAIAVLAVFVYELTKYWSSLSITGLVLSVFPMLILLYLAYRVYFDDTSDEDEM